MSVASVLKSARSVQHSLSLFQDLLGDYHPRDFAVRFWDGTVWEAEPGQPVRFTLVLSHPGSLRRMFWPPKRLTLFEAYIFGDYDIEGDLEAFIFVGKHIRDQKRSLRQKLKMGLRLFRAPDSDFPRLVRKPAQVSGDVHSVDRDRQAVCYHYDVSNEFYALWLDRNMVYTCAYFGSPDDSIETAQNRKLDHICRKLRLRPGDRVLELGCGWGAFAIHAAKYYGVSVLGVTLGKPQVEWATRRIQEEGLSDRCRVELRDYREVDEPEQFDKVVAIGIVEHVGLKLFPTYFGQAWKMLKPGGTFLSHGITMNLRWPRPPQPNFVNKYVFPDGELMPISRHLKAAEEAGFEVRDVECFREHYRLTCAQWARRLEENAEEAKRLTDEVTYRIYRLYLVGSVAGFRIELIQHYQTLLSKPNNGVSGLPLTRDDWYPTPVR